MMKDSLLIDNADIKRFLEGYWQKQVPGKEGYYMVKNRETDVIEKDLKYVRGGKYKTPYDYRWWSISFPFNAFAKANSEDEQEVDFSDSKNDGVDDNLSVKLDNDGNVDYDYYRNLPFDSKPGFVSKSKARDIEISDNTDLSFVTFDLYLGLTDKGKSHVVMLDGQKISIPLYACKWHGPSKRGNGYRFLIVNNFAKKIGII